MNKKGQFLDLMYIAFILLMIGIVGVIGVAVMEQFETQYAASGDIDAANVAIVSDYNNRQIGMIDGLFLIGLIGMSIVAIVSAFFVLSHPVFYIISAVVLGFLSWINAIYANIYQSIVSTPELVAYAEQFQVVPYVMRYFPAVMLVISFIVVIIMVAKK